MPQDSLPEKKRNLDLLSCFSVFSFGAVFSVWCQERTIRWMIDALSEAQEEVEDGAFAFGTGGGPVSSRGTTRRHAGIFEDHTLMVLRCLGLFRFGGVLGPSWPS